MIVFKNFIFIIILNFLYFLELVPILFPGQHFYSIPQTSLCYPTMHDMADYLLRS